MVGLDEVGKFVNNDVINDKDGRKKLFIGAPASSQTRIFSSLNN
jgi:hypothetical protein